MNECTACQTIQAFDSFRLPSLAFWRQSFVPNGRILFIRRLLMVINIYMYTESRKPKFRLDVMYIDCISQAGRISVCFDQIKKSANIDV